MLDDVYLLQYLLTFMKFESAKKLKYINDKWVELFNSVNQTHLLPKNYFENFEKNVSILEILKIFPNIKNFTTITARKKKKKKMYIDSNRTLCYLESPDIKYLQNKKFIIKSIEFVFNACDQRWGNTNHSKVFCKIRKHQYGKNNGNNEKILFSTTVDHNKKTYKYKYIFKKDEQNYWNTNDILISIYMESAPYPGAPYPGYECHVYWAHIKKTIEQIQ